MSRLRAAIYYPARKLLDWEAKWHKKLLELPPREKELELEKARHELELIYDMASDSAFAKEWFCICSKSLAIVVAQCEAGNKWEEV